MTSQLFIRVSWSYAMLVALVGVLIVASAGAAPTRATTSLVKPRTLYIEHGKIHKFAQDGDRIAWIGGRHYVVHLRTVTGRRTLSGRSSWVLGNAGPGAATHSASALVLGGTRAVWVKYGGGLTREAAIFTSQPGQKKPRLVDALGTTEFGGTYLTGLVASGQTILYGDARVTCELAEQCSTWSLTDGGVNRIIGTKSPRIVGIPPAFRIATGGRLVAVVPAKVTDPQRGEWGAEPNGPVNVYDLTGHRLGQVVPQGTVKEVALDWPDLAVIVTRPDGTTAIERYLFAPQGRLLSATDMPGASNLSIARGKVVFRVGNTIYLWWAVGKRPAILWRSLGKPIGLSIEGKRVAWAANGRIRALIFPY
jgi:hypothetical protein